MTATDSRIRQGVMGLEVQCPVCFEWVSWTDSPPSHAHPETYTEEEKRQAETLHSKECKLDHQEQCGWMYDGWDCKSHWGARHEYILKVRGVENPMMIKNDNGKRRSI